MGLISSRCVSSWSRQDGKTAIITGSNTGIGKEAAREFYHVGARVIMACRDVTKAGAAAKEIEEEGKGREGLGQLIVKKLDLGSLKSVRECANEILSTEEKVHILVNNAGIFRCPKSKTEDGFETQFGVNHLGHFLFTLLLIPKLIDSAPARIVNVSSAGHMRGSIDFEDLNWERRPYSPGGAYNQSKIANVLFTKELAERLKDKGVTVYALHPGVVQTEISRHLDESYFPGVKALWEYGLYFILKTPKQGAQTILHCALDEKAGNETGLYYSDSRVKVASAIASDKQNAKQLWQLSLKMIGIEEDKPV